MKTYIFFTTEGYSESPTAQSIENAQMLGRASGNNISSALDSLLDENPWILESGFVREKIFAEQIFDKKTKNNIKTVINYLWKDEQKHYEEYITPDHIYLVLKELKKTI